MFILCQLNVGHNYHSGDVDLICVQPGEALNEAMTRYCLGSVFNRNESFTWWTGLRIDLYVFFAIKHKTQTRSADNDCNSFQEAHTEDMAFLE